MSSQARAGGGSRVLVAIAGVIMQVMLGVIIISRVIDATGAYTNALYIFAVIMLASTVVSFIVQQPKSRARATRTEEARA